MTTDDQVHDERVITQYVTEKAICFFNHYFREHYLMENRDWETIREDFYINLMGDFMKPSEKK